MKKLFLAISLIIAFTRLAQASCQPGTLSVIGEFKKWEHPDYGWFCSLVEEISGKYFAISN